VAVGRLSRLDRLDIWCRKHLLPQWKVLAVPDESMFAVIIHSYYTKGQAVRKAEDLNRQAGKIPHVAFYFKPQKNTCF
jgi:hypothetical protein